ncbi:GTP 3',8-cyclase MoaA [bacterium (Candidatus Blackallbacteria) CG17_big_fil_post_rev_8_21_14_2_50_48_46]|uniref:GTP 3',8-cyclase n=1 Tax=bacterium (Candidatus Blackallbacteria) CG17_big_fil_post_rev_8_21_14_2_50_48_46 TaxID=2014261 RepID=A0A2M7G013_9BACT|nr:MAG: GTP 3',8-cyclase MoaA [bacterium (Candidatus Blackallbacteria) CG18_big_fil_WC_8_21_14_2_50_49_26]PIW15026.1 MAG: GTP 3',8-cyclase MoaA [bacterium (Candidatus Blackallbacteria) CG17_big_fil_post_rev_8_21_14_2_50_48_46]PIW47651.1 MAG: GTP 3',8-cyclase MoaA [bacterium (Candidatus Blackallbacteria) CG13_big_fil_rev_8_21_14_2_50_49_14]
MCLSSVALASIIPSSFDQKEAKQLLDPHGRRIRKLRVSLLDACNFRCFYCMPEKIRFSSLRNALKIEELTGICSALVAAGITQIRLTGGEPTLRPDFQEVVKSLSQLPIEKLGLTSNGFLLEQHLAFLKLMGCHYLNISLDSLSEENFNRMTRSKGFSNVLSSVLKARELGFSLKLNTVVMRNENDHEILDFVRFSEETGIEIRFLELMKIGQACQYQSDAFVSAEEMLDRIQAQIALQPVQVDRDSTAFSFHTARGGRIGFIASESRPFCGSCSRLRLSHDGQLRACLMLNRGESLRNLDPAGLEQATQQVLAMKPITRLDSISQDMYRIGG